MAKQKNTKRSVPKIKVSIIARWIQEQLDEHMLSEKLIEHILKLEKAYIKKFNKK